MSNRRNKPSDRHGPPSVPETTTSGVKKGEAKAGAKGDHKQHNHGSGRSASTRGGGRGSGRGAVSRRNSFDEAEEEADRDEDRDDLAGDGIDDEGDEGDASWDENEDEAEPIFSTDDDILVPMLEDVLQKTPRMSVDAAVELLLPHILPDHPARAQVIRALAIAKSASEQHSLVTLSKRMTSPSSPVYRHGQVVLAGPALCATLAAAASASSRATSRDQTREQAWAMERKYDGEDGGEDGGSALNLEDGNRRPVAEHGAAPIVLGLAGAHSSLYHCALVPLVHTASFRVLTTLCVFPRHDLHLVVLRSEDADASCCGVKAAPAGDKGADRAADKKKSKESATGTTGALGATGATGGPTAPLLHWSEFMTVARGANAGSIPNVVMGHLGVLLYDSQAASHESMIQEVMNDLLRSESKTGKRNKQGAAAGESAGGPSGGPRVEKKKHDRKDGSDGSEPQELVFAGYDVFSQGDRGPQLLLADLTRYSQLLFGVPDDDLSELQLKLIDTWLGAERGGGDDADASWVRAMQVLFEKAHDADRRQLEEVHVDLGVSVESSKILLPAGWFAGNAEPTAAATASAMAASGATAASAAVVTASSGSTPASTKTVKGKSDKASKSDSKSTKGEAKAEVKQDGKQHPKQQVVHLVSTRWFNERLTKMRAVVKAMKPSAKPSAAKPSSKPSAKLADESELKEQLARMFQEFSAKWTLCMTASEVRWPFQVGVRIADMLTVCSASDLMRLVVGEDHDAYHRLLLQWTPGKLPEKKKKCMMDAKHVAICIKDHALS